MVDCDYCGDSFGDESSYLRHLHDAHDDELGRIDRRRVADELGLDEGGRDAGTYVLGGLVLVVVAAFGLTIAWAVSGSIPFLGGGGGGANAVQEPYGYNEIHEHGTMEATIDGQEVDFSQDRYQLQADCFHFERNEGRVWHTHCRGVTVQWALNSLGIQTAANGSSITFDGKTYRESAGWNVSVQVNGEPVTPGSYVLEGVGASNAEQGDDVDVVVSQE